jgi:hypothetical protein
MVKIEYSHDTRIGNFAYDDGFLNRITLDTTVDDTAEVREVREYLKDGRQQEYQSWGRVEPVYQMRFPAFAYTFHSLAAARGHDNVFLTDTLNNTSRIDIIEIQSQRIENTAYSMITVKFVALDNKIFYQ